VGLVGYQPGSLAMTRLEAEQAQRENIKRQYKLQAQLEGVNQELVQVVIRLDELENVKIPQAEQEVTNAEAKAEESRAKAEKLRKKLELAQTLLKQLEESLANAGEEAKNARAGVAKLARQQLKGEVSGSVSLSGGLGLIAMDAKDSESYIRALESDAVATRVLSRVFDQAQWLIATGSNEQERMDQIREVVNQLTVEAEAQAKEAERLAQVARDKRNELIVLEQEMAQAKIDYENSKAEIERQKVQAEEEEAKLNAEIARIAAEELALGTPTGPAPSPGFFGWPLSVINITQYFGGMTPSGEIYNPNHDAIDLAAPCGTPIFASAPGKVSKAGQDFSGNVFVVISHGMLGENSYITSYNHLTSFIVSQAQNVAKGEVIGYVGSTGWSTGCHLHFTIAVNGVNVDPLPYLQ
jgi:murein DD-endopeptidase MepM/ murein hydrolase activator NlpD